MSYAPRPYDTLQYALAQTEQQDERDREYWEPKVSKDGWTLHYADEHHIGRQMPYAMALISVWHDQGNSHFYAPAKYDYSNIEHAVVVFDDEIMTFRRRNPYNRQSDELTFAYSLYGKDHFIRDNEQYFRNLPTGNYRLEIKIPLFSMEKVVSRFTAADGRYSVSTTNGVYTSFELEKNDGFLGLSRSANEAEVAYVWSLDQEPTNIDKFYHEMHRRALAHCPGYEDEYAGFAEDNTRPAFINNDQTIEALQYPQLGGLPVVEHAIGDVVQPVQDVLHLLGNTQPPRAAPTRTA